jgi:predicted dehydrogenase
MSDPGCEVVALAEIREGLGRKVARRHGIPRVFASHRDLLAAGDLELDGIVAIQTFGLHIDIIPELLKRGVPVLTEKPLADTLENARVIASVANDTGTPLYQAYHKRSDPAAARAARLIADWKAGGRYGALRYIRITMPPGDWSADGFRHGLKTTETYASNWGDGSPYAKFINYYIHQVNLMRFLLDEDYDVTFADPDAIVLVTRSAGGISGVLECGPYTTTLDWQEQALICFERAWIRIELPAPLVVNRPGRITVFTDGKGEEPLQVRPVLPPHDAMRCQAENFLKAIRGEPNPLCRFEDSLKDLETSAQALKLIEAAGR